VAVPDRAQELIFVPHKGPLLCPFSQTINEPLSVEGSVTIGVDRMDRPLRECFGTDHGRQLTDCVGLQISDQALKRRLIRVVFLLAAEVRNVILPHLAPSLSPYRRRSTPNRAASQTPVAHQN
jgi:hypothetical protein